MLGWKHWLASWACFGMLLYPAVPSLMGGEAASGSEPAPQAKPEAARPSPRLELNFIPSSAVAAMILHPQALLSGPYAEWAPVEVITAAGLQKFGIDPVQIREVVFVVATPKGASSEPEVGLILRFSQQYSAKALLAKMPFKEAEAEGKKYFITTEPEKLAVYLPDESTIVVSPSQVTLVQMISAKEADSPLVNLLKKVDCSATFTTVVSLDAMRGLIDQTLAHAPPLPPQLAEFLKIPKLTSAVLLRIDLVEQAGVSLTLRATDEPSAAELLRLVQQALEMGRQATLAQTQQAMNTQPQSDDPVQQAMLKYQRRMSTTMVNHMFDMVQPAQAGQNVKVMSLHFDSNPAASVAVVGILVALLLPAVQAAREAAYRNQSMGKMKEIGLTILNHENAYGRLPAPAIYDKQGHPLLSWRVQVLPYLEEGPLYKEFHLDEAWDSPHNKALIARIPATYCNPSRPVDGKTNYLLPVGPGTAFPGKVGLKISDIADGTSKTIMLVEANEDRAVIWTKPDDLEVNLDKPLAGLNQFRPTGIFAAFFDDHIQLIPNTVDPEALKAAFTPAGGENLPLPR